MALASQTASVEEGEKRTERDINRPRERERFYRGQDECDSLPVHLGANSIALLKSLLTSLLRFTVLKNSIYKTKKLKREVNRLFNRAIEFASGSLLSLNKHSVTCNRKPLYSQAASKESNTCLLT